LTEAAQRGAWRAARIGRGNHLGAVLIEHDPRIEERIGQYRTRRSSFDRARARRKTDASLLLAVGEVDRNEVARSVARDAAGASVDELDDLGCDDSELGDVHAPNACRLALRERDVEHVEKRVDETEAAARSIERVILEPASDDGKLVAFFFARGD